MTQGNTNTLGSLVRSGCPPHYEIWSGTKEPDTEGWIYSTCTKCGQRWRAKTVTEYLP